MQYGNPYFAQPFQQIQPYQDRLAQLQNSYQQAMPYGQAQIQQPMPQVPQIPMLQAVCRLEWPRLGHCLQNYTGSKSRVHTGHISRLAICKQARNQNILCW